MGRRPRRIDGELRSEVIRLAARGATCRDILEVVDTSMGAITIVLKQWGGVTRSDTTWEPSPHRMSLDDRIEIRLGLERSDSYQRIGTRIGRHKSTVCREVNRNGGRESYKPVTAHDRAFLAARRPKPTKLGLNPRLCQWVVEGLEKLWSPEEIAHRLAVEFDDDETMRVSHETIYKSTYVQGRGSLRKELINWLFTDRTCETPIPRPNRTPRKDPGDDHDLGTASRSRRSGCSWPLER